MDDKFIDQLAQILKGKKFPAPKWAKKPPKKAIMHGTVPLPIQAIITMADKLGEAGHEEERKFLITMASSRLGDKTVGGMLYAVSPSLGIGSKWELFLVFPR